MRKFREKSEIIEAIQWDGKNFDEIKKIVPTIEKFYRDNILLIPHRKGFFAINLNDWIISRNGFSYGIDSNDLEELYEAVDAE